MNNFVSEYFDRLERLLGLEAETEKQAYLAALRRNTPAQSESSGFTLTNLNIREEGAGLGGKLLLTLGKRNQNLDLPWTRLHAGTPVIMSEEGVGAGGLESGWRGIVSRVERRVIQVAFPEWPELVSDRPVLRLDRSTDEISRQRQIKALRAAREVNSGRLRRMRAVILGIEPTEFTPIKSIPGLSASLNDSQKNAVEFALSAHDLAIIHGPPGTGKTTTLAELINQLVQRGERVLVCAPSNLAVDNLLERLILLDLPVLRLGHPARVLPELRAHTLDEIIENHPEVRLAQKLARQANILREKAGKLTRAAPEPGARQAMRQEARQMLAESHRIEAQLIERELGKAQVICATLTGLDVSLLGEHRFDCCVIDEAGQATEPAAWIPILLADRLVLAGDPYQLPPTVLSPEAFSQGFNISLLERLMGGSGSLAACRLIVQYRMHHAIMQFSSVEFYEGSQKAHPSVENHLLDWLPGVSSVPITATPVEWIDTAGAGFSESQEINGDSRFNQQEATLIVRKVLALLEQGVLPEYIAIITPYAAQARLLREYLDEFPKIEVDSVDGFQGREKETILVSLVRSNPEGEIGFLEDMRRMNVALTRARRKLIVVGDSATIGGYPFYRRFLSYIDQIGAYHSVWEEMI